MGVPIDPQGLFWGREGAPIGPEESKTIKGRQKGARDIRGYKAEGYMEYKNMYDVRV